MKTINFSTTLILFDKESNGEVLTAKQFRLFCNRKALIETDGYGYLALYIDDVLYQSSIPVFSHDYKSGVWKSLNWIFTHVIWYHDEDIFGLLRYDVFDHKIT